MTVKLVVIVVYLLVLLGIGAVASRRVADVKDYFAAGKKLGFLAVAFSARATGESAWLLLGLTGMGAAIGLKAMWVVLGEVLGVMGAWLLMSRRFKRLTDRYDAITVPDYLEGRFRDEHTHRLRVVAAFALTVFVTIYVSAQIDATGKAFETFLSWDYYVGALIGFAVVVVYIVAGGFLAVVWSDVFQGTLMVIGLVALPLAGVLAAGGWGEVTAALERIDPRLLSWTAGEDLSLMTVASILGLSLLGLGFMGSPQIFVRFLALRDESEIRTGAGVAFAWTVLADTGAVLTGMIGRAALTEPGQELEAVLGSGGEAVLPQLVEHVFPLVIVGVYIAIVLSAIMSTVDSLLVVAGSAAVRDWYQKVRHPTLPDRELVPISRAVTFGLALAALCIAMVVAVVTPDRTVFWFVIFGWSGIAATFCPTMILSLFWRRMTARGALAAMVGGFVAVPLFKFWLQELDGVGPYLTALTEFPPAFLLSGVLGVVVSLLDVDGAAAAEGELDVTG